MYEIVDFFASVGVLIAKGVKDDTAVDVYVFAEGVVLKGIASVDDWGSYVLFLLLGLFSEEGLVVLEVLQEDLILISI